MAILTPEEGWNVLRLDEDHPMLRMLLPAIDAYLERATGHNWAADTPVDAVAKAAAQMLLVQWFENPGMVGSAASLGYGLDNLVTQLQARALLMAATDEETG